MPAPTQLELWLQGFPRQEAEDRLASLEAEAATLREALALHNRLSRGAGVNGSTPASSESKSAPPNRPESIRQVLRDRNNAPTKPGLIKETMIKNGWLADDSRSMKLFYSAMSTMTKRGHLLRLQDGRYMLPPERMGGGAEA